MMTETLVGMEPPSKKSLKTSLKEPPDLAGLAVDADAVQALVAAEGFDATPEEIRDVVLETFAGELSEEQLAAIAGGTTDTQFLLVGLTGGLAGGVGIASLAVAAGV